MLSTLDFRGRHQYYQIPFDTGIHIEAQSKNINIDDLAHKLEIRCLDSAVTRFCSDIGNLVYFARSSLLELAGENLARTDAMPFLQDAEQAESNFGIKIRPSPISDYINPDMAIVEQRLELNAVVLEINLGQRISSERANLFVVLTHVDFENGSLKSNIKGFVFASVTIVGGVAAAFQIPPVSDTYISLKNSKTIEQTLSGELCVTNEHWNISTESVKSVALEEYNYAANGLSDTERSRRICNTQLALKIASANPGAIDGVFGVNTFEALVRFGVQNDITPDIESTVFRGLLNEEVCKKLSEVWRT